jgi:PAS domain S-box-containing protein
VLFRSLWSTLHPRMLRVRVGLLFILILVAAGVAGAAASAKDVQAYAFPGKRILILHSYFKGYKWTDDEHQGITSVLEPAVGAENIYVEYLDTKRFYWDSYHLQLSAVYRQKYGPYRPDLVIVTDNNAFDFMRRFGDTIFPGVPVVFCGVNYAKETDLMGHPNFTGVSEEADLKASLDTALRLQPGTQSVYTLHDNTETGMIVAERMKTLAPLYPGITFIQLNQLSFQAILAQLKVLPPHSIVFYTFFSRDASGQLYDNSRTMRLAADASNAPIFGAWDFNLGYGIVGGMLTGGVANGEAAARIALRILAGEKPSGIPIQRDTPNKLLFDYSALSKFHIPLSALPKGSEVINLPESAFTRYRTLLLASTGIVAFLVTVIAILFANISRRKRAEEDLLSYQDHLEEQVRERSAQLQAANDELQGDLIEREKVERALRRAESDLRSIFENAAEGIYQSTAEGRFIVVNPALAQMAGFRDSEEMVEAVKDIRTDFYIDRDRRIAFETALATQTEVRGLESQIRRTDGGVIWILENARAIRNDKGVFEHYEGIIQDITDRKKVEEALRTSQELLNKTFTSLLDALLIVHAGDRTIRDCNPATRQLFGYSREELLGKSTRLLHVDDASYEELETKALSAFQGKGFLHLSTFHMRRKDGEIFICEMALMPLHGEDGVLTSWVAVIRDITEQRQTEAKLDLTRRKLRALAAETTLLEERERRGIATQLHDQLGALLAMGKVKLGTLLKATVGTPFAAPLEEIHSLVGEAVNETRSLTWELSPPVLYQLGLSAAIEWLCEETEKRNGLTVRFSQEGVPVELSDERRFLLFSAARELLLNVVKHAEARRVSIRLRWMDTAVESQVKDDGKGFDVAGIEVLRDARKSFGLFNIQERVADLDGRVDILSSPGAGSAVTVMLPFRGAMAP